MGKIAVSAREIAHAVMGVLEGWDQAPDRCLYGGAMPGGDICDCDWCTAVNEIEDAIRDCIVSKESSALTAYHYLQGELRVMQRYLSHIKEHLAVCCVDPHFCLRRENWPSVTNPADAEELGHAYLATTEALGRTKLVLDGEEEG